MPAFFEFEFDSNLQSFFRCLSTTTTAHTTTRMSESSVLVIAHPGHELRAFTFLRRLQPKVAVLTDGSGSQGISRIARTQRILRENGCQDGKPLRYQVAFALLFPVIAGGAGFPPPLESCSPFRSRITTSWSRP